jgi:Flp pilus assembly protein TadB
MEDHKIKQLIDENKELRERVKKLEKVVAMAEEVTSRFIATTLPMYVGYLKDAVRDYKISIDKG